MVEKDTLDDKLALYQALLDTHDEIILKGKTSPYTSVNGHMFSILDKEGNLGLRLPMDERIKFINQFHTKLHEAYGKVMKEYVRVPPELMENTETLKTYLVISYNYTKNLKPKSTKR